MKGWKKIFHANGDQKKAGVEILISNKIDFEVKAVKRTRRTLHNDQRSSQEEDITITYKYAPNKGALQYVRQILSSLKGEINSNTN